MLVSMSVVDVDLFIVIAPERRVIAVLYFITLYYANELRRQQLKNSGFGAEKEYVLGQEANNPGGISLAAGWSIPKRHEITNYNQVAWTGRYKNIEPRTPILIVLQHSKMSPQVQFCCHLIVR